jgi:hypothetical protein
MLLHRKALESLSTDAVRTGMRTGYRTHGEGVIERRTKTLDQHHGAGRRARPRQSGLSDASRCEPLGGREMSIDIPNSVYILFLVCGRSLSIGALSDSFRNSQ